MNSDLKIDGKTLLVIPCCAVKRAGGSSWKSVDNCLGSLVTLQGYRKIVVSRTQLLNALRRNKKYISCKYSKNTRIKNGPDFGAEDLSGQYLPAITRYKGNLYSADTDFSRIVTECLNSPNCPKILILSALYGPLHPFDMIQDYNLKMSDEPAKRTWKEHFPPFLKEYVQKNEVSNIRLYLGSSTAYFEVAKKAVTPLLKTGILDQVIQFEVESGGSYHTPHNHGLLIASHLKKFAHWDCERYAVETWEFTRKIIPKAL